MSDEASASNDPGAPAWDMFPGLEYDLSGYPLPLLPAGLSPELPESIPKRPVSGMAAIILLVKAAYIGLVLGEEHTFKAKDKDREIIAEISQVMIGVMYPPLLKTEWKVTSETVRKLVDDGVDAHEKLRTNNIKQTWLWLRWYGRRGHLLEIVHEKLLKGGPQEKIDDIRKRVIEAEEGLLRGSHFTMNPMQTLVELGFARSTTDLLPNPQSKYQPWSVPPKPECFKTECDVEILQGPGEHKFQQPHYYRQPSPEDPNSEILLPRYLQKRTRKDILEVLILVEVTVFHWGLGGASSQSFCGV
ncbi:hypothetical protein HYFRA_00013140 [Hymenoscyphus fraxineus]|uniref:Uncharacterized protein n=1 Tax=Hymenoscyphus fraxineus TaxID=746836 RepID=A0A9N9L873_9HELO|nr:hypothetical protein HYFRA_00013140 [Hymenoscyphus fraxineus]